MAGGHEDSGVAAAMGVMTGPFGLGFELTSAAGRLLAGLRHWFFLPGDRLLGALLRHASPLARFLGLGADDYGGAASALVAALAWLAALVVLSVAYAAIRDVDAALTRFLARVFAEAKRRTRVGAALLAYRLRRRARAPEGAGIELTEEPALSERELDVLRAHAELPPGAALSVSDVARALGVRPSETEEALARLRRLNLLSVALNGSEGESAYSLTPAGRAFSFLRRLERAGSRA